MVELKSDELSKRYKEQGNEELLKKNHKRALVLYNKAICYAESDECLSLGFANRSAVYLDRGFYDECLQNIQWARENNYPEDKIQKLNEREEKCKQLKASKVRDPINDPWNFLKLSLPPNPKIPFIVDCLEMKVTEKDGRGIYATRNISTGDIISIEDSIVQNISYAAGDDFFFCGNCHKTCFFNLIPCSKTATFMFCSEECRKKLYQKVDVNKCFMRSKAQTFEFNQAKLRGDIEEKFGGRDKLVEFLKSVPDITKLNYSVFDFDWSDPNDPEYGINQIKCFLSYIYSFGIFEDHEVDYMDIPQDLPEDEKLIEIMVKHAFGIMVMMSKVDLNITLGSAFGNLINHSCYSNAQRFQIGTKVAYYAMKPIKAGDQICVSYSMEVTKAICHFLDMPPEFRQHFLETAYGFECNCIACAEDLGPEDTQIISEETMKKNHLKYHAAELVAKSGARRLKPIIDLWKSNNEFINMNYENMFSKDVHLVEFFNYRLINLIAEQCG